MSRSIPERHQLKIARDTLKMPDAMAGVMGGPTKPEARRIIRALTGHNPTELHKHYGHPLETSNAGHEHTHNGPHAHRGLGLGLPVDDLSFESDADRQREQIGDAIQFGTLHPDGTLTNTRTLQQSAIRACPFVIFDPSHYREDGSCKCNDKAEQVKMVREWGYTIADLRKAGLVPARGATS